MAVCSKDPPNGVGFLPGAGVGLLPGAGVGLLPGAGVGFLPGAGVGLLPCAGVGLLPNVYECSYLWAGFLPQHRLPARQVAVPPTKAAAFSRQM